MKNFLIWPKMTLKIASKKLKSEFWHFPPIFVPIKSDHKLQVFKKPAKLTIFGIFIELLATKNVNESSLRSQCRMRLFFNFQTLCIVDYKLKADYCIFLCFTRRHYEKRFTQQNEK